MIINDFDINTLLTISSLENCHLLAGKEGLHHTVTGIIVMEAPDIERWLSKGQILLSSLFTIKEYSDKKLIQLIKKMADYGASALIVKKDRFVNQIPTVIITHCNKYHLPLIEIPNSTKYSSIEIEVMQTLFNRKELMLERFYHVHYKLTQFALTQPSSLAMLQQLKLLIKNPIALFDKEFQCIATTDVSLTKRIERVISSEMFHYNYTNYNCIKEYVKVIDERITYTKYTIRFMTKGDINNYIVIYATEKPLDLSDFMAIENAISYFQMESIKLFAISEMKQNHYNDLVDDLMYGRFASKEAMNDAVSFLGLSYHEKYTAFVVQIMPIDKKFKNTTQKKLEYQNFVDKFCRDWEKIIYRIRTNRVVFIVPTSKISINQLKEKIHKLLLYIIDTHHSYYRVGMSHAGYVDELAKSSSQSLEVLQIGHKLSEQNFIMHYDDLGIYKMLGSLSEHIDLKQIIPSNLIELHNKNPKLIKTLKAFLDYNQNIKKSAEILFIHPKTMKYRIEQLKRILEIDFNNAQQVLQYAFGLCVLIME